MSSITTKDLHMAIKRGEAPINFASRYGMTKEGLYAHIRHISPNGAQSFIKGFEKNEKRISKRKPASQVTEEAENIEEVSEKVCEEVKVFLEDETEDKTTTREQQISELKKYEGELSVELCTLEVKHKKLVTSRREIIGALQECNKRILEMQKMIEAEGETVAKLREAYDEFAEQMSTNMVEQEAIRSMLDELRENLESLEVINIFLYEDGSLECDDMSILDVPEEQVADEVSRMVKMPEAEEFTLKALKALAKLTIMQKQPNAPKVEIVFEQDNMEHYYEMLHETGGE